MIFFFLRVCVPILWYFTAQMFLDIRRWVPRKQNVFNGLRNLKDLREITRVEIVKITLKMLRHAVRNVNVRTRLEKCQAKDEGCQEDVFYATACEFRQSLKDITWTVRFVPIWQKIKRNACELHVPIALK